MSFYYRHSGRISIPGLAVGLLAGCAASFVLAWVYAYAILYIPLAGYVTFILTGGFGLLVGVITAMVVRAAKTRNAPAAALVSLVIGLFALYSAWVVWLAALFARGGKEVHVFPLFASPDVVRVLVELINAKGAWSLKGSTPTGAVLWFLWGIEALIVIGLPVLLGVGSVDVPFCEECGDWCSEGKEPRNLVATSRDDARERLEAKDFAWFRSVGLAPPDATRVARVSFALCDKCKTTNAISVEELSTTVNAKGEASTTTTSWVKFLLLDERELEAARSVLASLAPEPPPAEATPSG